MILQQVADPVVSAVDDNELDGSFFTAHHMQVNGPEDYESGDVNQVSF